MHLLVITWHFQPFQNKFPLLVIEFQSASSFLPNRLKWWIDKWVLRYFRTSRCLIDEGQHSKELCDLRNSCSTWMSPHCPPVYPGWWRGLNLGPIYWQPNELPQSKSKILEKFLKIQNFHNHIKTSCKYSHGINPNQVKPRSNGWESI